MKIVVACGGTSPEREVSLNSGKAVCEALAERGHSVILEDVRSPREFVEKWHTFGADGVFIALHGDWGETAVSRPVLTRTASLTPVRALRHACLRWTRQ